MMRARLPRLVQTTTKMRWSSLQRRLKRSSSGSGSSRSKLSGSSKANLAVSNVTPWSRKLRAAFLSSHSNSSSRMAPAHSRPQNKTGTLWGDVDRRSCCFQPPSPLQLDLHEGELEVVGIDDVVVHAGLAEVGATQPQLGKALLALRRHQLQSPI